MILDVQTSRVAGLYRGGARWDEGKETVSEWKPDERRDTVYAKFAGNDCAAYPGAGSQMRLKLHGLINIWEPRSLPELMNLYTAEPFAGR